MQTNKVLCLYRDTPTFLLVEFDLTRQSSKVLNTGDKQLMFADSF